MDEVADFDNSDFEDEDFYEYGFSGLMGRVRAFAIKAHGSQKDKSGLPYVTHLDAVAVNTVRLFGFDPSLILTAYLHDVVEDTKYSQDDIDISFPFDVADAVYAITKKKGQPNHEYIGEVARDEIASKVKLADLMHNSDPARLALLPAHTSRRLKKKYYPAIYRLCSALEIESWISYEQAVAAIREESTQALPRELTVASLISGDHFQFVDNGAVFKVKKVSSAISGPGFTQRDITLSDESIIRVKSSIKVTLLPRKTSESFLAKTVAQYMGEQVKA